MSTSSSTKTVDPRRNLPSVRSLQLLQESLASGVFKTRHLQSLEADPKALSTFVGLLECTRQLQQQHSTAAEKVAGTGTGISQKRLQGMQMRNLICISHAACPEEAEQWLQCVRSAVKAMRAEAAGEERVGPPANCTSQRRALERCTQRASSGALFAAVLPADRSDVSL